MTLRKIVNALFKRKRHDIDVTLYVGAKISDPEKVVKVFLANTAQMRSQRVKYDNSFEGISVIARGTNQQTGEIVQLMLHNFLVNHGGDIVN